MNIQEFAKLKAGDEVRHGVTGSTGRVAEVTDEGVRIQWGGVGPLFLFTAMSNAWKHWNTDTGGKDANASR